jgi:hypothetical protein
VCGYKSDPAEPGKLVVDPDTAPIVKRVFDAMEELGSAGAVLRRLKSEGVTVPVRVSRYGRARGGAPLKRQQILTLLRNPLFIGRVQWGPAFRDDCHEPIITQAQFERVQRLLDANRRGRTNTTRSRDYGYPLRGLVRCRCGAMMTPKGAFAKGRQYHYYSCTTKAHQTREGCGAKDVPAEALEQAVVRRVSEIASSDTDRRLIRDEGVRLVEADATRLETEIATARHRLSEVAGHIARQVALLRDPAFAALESVKRELQGLEAEQAELRDRVSQLEARCEPLAAVIGTARAFIENWTGLDAILAQATPDELRTILPHFVEVVEIRPSDDAGRTGEYRLAMLPGLRSGSRDGESESGGPLTDPPQFRGVERKAPLGVQVTTPLSRLLRARFGARHRRYRLRRNG